MCLVINQQECYLHIFNVALCREFLVKSAHLDRLVNLGRQVYRYVYASAIVAYLTVNERQCNTIEFKL